MRPPRRVALLALLLVASAGPRWFNASAPVRYVFAFPEPEHRWMRVEAEFAELDPAPLELRMSVSSPGRYSRHDFAKNVYDVRAFTEDGDELSVARADPSGWIVAGHGGAVTVRYKVYGDRLDGTYLAVDSTHAHINMPAAVMWARGLDDRPATLKFEPPPDAGWRAATQLHPASGPFEFTAPNLQYLMDSPVELGPGRLRTFSVGAHTFRFSAHDTSTDAELDDFVRDVEKVVREEGAVFGEFPDYEPGSYTFLADYLPYASGDAMEHRNSTVITAAATIRGDRLALLDTVAHEFFHGWNVERIRPRELEPFDFDRANPSATLWLAEGFTQYYAPLVLCRAGLLDLDGLAATLTGLVDAVTNTPARIWRSAEDVSRMALFIDGGREIDRTNWSSTVLSYYQFGAAVALGLDLALRDRSGGRVTLDDFMRAMWRVHGKPGGSREGYVDRPYTSADAEASLAEAAGDPAFAREFFARHIRGRDIVDYRRLLTRAGFVVRKQMAGRAWLGDLDLESRGGGARVAGLVPPSAPAYEAGIDEDDVIEALGGQRVASAGDVVAVLARFDPGDRVPVQFRGRDGRSKTATVTLAENPHLEVVPIERSGGSPTAAQRAFRDAWLNSRQERR
jgi:predicted metalloprotease with PDZ domain